MTAEWQIEEVSPQDAAQLLRLATPHYFAERLSGARVAQYAQQMAGSWTLDPDDPVTITSDGYLASGLNRLTAVMVSGQTQLMAVLRDDEPMVGGRETHVVNDGPLYRLTDAAAEPTDS